jgi:catecholate siderophore receptor
MSTVKIEDTEIDPNPNAEVGVPYKAKTSGDERHTRAIAETPASISVVTKAAIDESGYTDLKEILNAQPGITVGTGENGNAFGDRYIIRGQEARSDVFVDGLRDPGMTTRESFAVEQLEISRGPNSSFAGRGTAGGAINAITKQATTALNFGNIGAAVGTDKHTRVTVDVNESFGETFAIRGNAVYSYEEVPDRAPADRERKGLALSGRYEPTDKFSLVVDYYGLRAEDLPDLGSYLVGTVPNRVPAENVAVYSQMNDFQKSDVDTLTARINYTFTPTLMLVNRTRYGTSENGYGTSGASATQPRYDGATGLALPADTGYLDNGHTGWQDVEYIANQTNLRWDKELFGKKNEFIFGLEYTDHKVTSAQGNNTAGYATAITALPNCKTTAGIGTNNAYCFAPAGQLFNGVLVVPSTITGRIYGDKQPKQQDWEVKDLGAYIMDTVDLTDKFTVFAGVRLDDFDLSLQRYGAVNPDYGYSDTLFNAHLGLTYKLTDTGMIYASASTAQDINGGEPDSGTNSGYGGLVVYDGNAAGALPETSVNYELGTKWNVFDQKLLITAALFQTTKSDVMEGADYLSVGTFNSGKNQVRGFEFDVVGKLTDKLTLQAGFTTMESEVLESATPLNIGKVVSNFADQSASAQLKYDFTEDFALGVAGKYQSIRYGGQPDTAAAYLASGEYSQPVPAYTVYDVFATYRFNKDFDVRLNVGNVSDEDYYLAVYRSGSFLYKGDARNYRLTLNYAL